MSTPTLRDSLRPVNLPSRARDLTGCRFGKWLALFYLGADKRRQSLWLCVCDCGQEKIVRMWYLVQGRSQSCGCSTAQFLREKSTKHGLSHSRTFNSWASMIQRCQDLNCPNYPQYGGAGVRVCERWQVFQAFLDDMGERPAGTSIDRIDNDGGYSPENCRWATRTEQARNRRYVHLLTFEGRTLSLSEWAREIGVPRHTLRYRLHHLGWTVERAFTTPLQPAGWNFRREQI